MLFGVLRKGICRMGRGKNGAGGKGEKRCRKKGTRCRKREKGGVEKGEKMCMEGE